MVTDNQALSSALYTAIGQNDLAQVQNLIANGVPQQSETPAQSETTQSETAQTEAPVQTEAPQQTDAATTPEMVDPPEQYAEDGVTVIG